MTGDRLVERASILEVLDPSTHISKLDFKLGWPASPRDCILISRVMTDDLNTLVYLATSLPRSMAAYEPAFLRPNPPYVRSHVHLFAWCIHMPLQKPGKARMSLFQRWNLKGAILSSTPLELTSLLTGLVEHTRSFSDSLPLFNAFGDHFALSNSTYRAADEVMVFEYAVLPDDDLLIDADQTPQESSLEQLEVRRQAARLDRAAEILLPVAHGWDIQVKCQPASTVSHDWSAVAELSSVRPGNRICFRISHARPPDSNSLTKVTLAFRRLAGGKSLRLNQQLLHVSQIDEFTPKAMQHSKDVSLLEDTATLAAPIHLSAESASIASSSAQLTPTDPRHQAIQAQIKRSYTYFASLLQEPEAKWRHVTENRGVSIGQLDSPDRTVTIYRAIATFVGVGVWDLCSAILSPGARKVWDKTVEEVHFLSTLGELSSLLHMQFKAVWPAW